MSEIDNLTKSLNQKLISKQKEKGNQALTINGLLSDVKAKERFNKLLGEKSEAFMSSIINVVKSNSELQLCDPYTVLGSAVVAATMDLPIEPNLGFAYIIPYNTRINNQYVKVAQFQIGYKGFIQLAMRSGAYKTISATEIYEGEIIKFNRITNEFEMGEPISDKVVGYIAYFRLLNGFEKYLYMTKEQVVTHAMTYSKSYQKPNSIWKTNFDAMATKTVLKRLLSKFGILSIQMQRAFLDDNNTIVANGEDEYKLEHQEEEKENEIIIDTTVNEVKEKKTRKRKKAKDEEVEGETFKVLDNDVITPVEEANIINFKQETME